MNSKTPLALCLALALVPLPTAAASDDCTNHGGLVDHTTLTIGVDDSATFYVDVREVAGDEYLFSAWIYRESNGIPGLQRGPPCDDLPPGAEPDGALF